MKKVIVALGILAFLACGIFFALIMWWKTNTSALSSDSTQVKFLINKGTSAEKIGKDLQEEGLIKSALAFKMYVQLFNKQSDINAGEFSLSPNMDVSEIVDKLGEGPELLWVTIPEGYRREQIAFLFEKTFSLESTDFVDQFLVLTKGKEGRLFPDTYLFPREITAQLVVSTLENTFDKRIATLQSAIDSSSLSEEEIITMASLVERETITEAERPIVAGILFNRLNLGMPLQVDAGVQYALANRDCVPLTASCEWWPTPLRGDLEIESPYNTYLFQGLPPAPVANPGLASISAVVSPEDSDYLYYIHNEGKIYYARTLEEHNANVAKYLR